MGRIDTPSKLRAIALAAAAVGVVLYFRSLDFLFHWLWMVFDRPADQQFYEWLAVLLVAPIIPSASAFLAAILAVKQQRVLSIALICASLVAVVPEWVLYSDMMTPGIWGDCYGCGPERHVLGSPTLPLVTRIPYASWPYITYPAAIALALVFITSYGFLLSSNRANRLQLALGIPALAVLLIGGCIEAHQLLRIGNWFILWRAVSLGTALVTIAAAAAAVAIRRQMLLAALAALLAVVATYAAVHTTAFLLLTAG